jgi:tRNA pseudouridine32 synthase/23S rRNA pseudouridine746 synthase
VVEGTPDAAEGTIDLPLGRLDDKIGWWMKHDPQGQPSVTNWKVMGHTRSGLTWLELEPLTGRTHQIRVHCAETGWPVHGDAVYGTAQRFGGPPLHLHAREISVPIYKNRDPVVVSAPVPAHMRARLLECGWNGEEIPLQSLPSPRQATEPAVSDTPE